MTSKSWTSARCSVVLAAILFLGGWSLIYLGLWQVGGLMVYAAFPAWLWAFSSMLAGWWHACAQRCAGRSLPR